MNRHALPPFVLVLSLSGLLSSPALAAGPGEGDAQPEGAGNEAAGSAGLSASGGVAGSAELAGSTRRAKSADDGVRWIDRWPPENHMGELGVYVGAFFPRSDLELFEASDALPDEGFKRYRPVALGFGLRGGYYPLRFFGIEGEGGLVPSRLEEGGSATIWTVRGHLVGQLGLWSVTPFVLAGAGVLGVNSERDAVGSEVDVSLHFGGGVKFYINPQLVLRLDLRDVIAAQRGVGEGVTNNLELLAGLSWTFGRKPGGPTDSDGDGIIDRSDKCPLISGPRPSGCPRPDRDKDGIIDPEDQCPDDPETRNGYEDADGCPDEVPAELVDLAGIMRGIQFDSDQATIRSKSKPELDAGLKVMQSFGRIKIEISGHTDSRGAHSHNMDLSRRRAESVKEWFVEQGVAAERMQTRGAGPHDPIETNGTAQGRQANRRIEVEILSQ